MRVLSLLPVLGLCLCLLPSSGCQMERRKSDAELGLNQEQARGRVIYDRDCIRCHEPYSRWGTHGPSLKDLYKKSQMPSGMPVNDERLADVILLGKAKMPAFGNSLNNRQLHELLAYLKTL